MYKNIELTPVGVTARIVQILLFITLLPVLSVPSVTFAEESPKPIHIEADNIERVGEGGEAKASGDVTIKFDGKTVTGDNATYNTDTGAGSVTGNVLFTDTNGRMTCDQVDFISTEETGVLYNAKGVLVDDIKVSGKRIERHANDRYVIEDGTFSTCNESEPHWSFHSSRTDLTLEGYAHLKHMSLRAGKVPVFYLPYFIVPVKTKRTTGMLAPSVGVSSENGFQMENSFFWAIADNADATFGHKYLGDAGNQVNGQLRYILSEKSEGQIDAEYLMETDANKSSDRNMWKLKSDLRHTFDNGVKNLVHIDMESEDSIDREYGDGVDGRTRRYTDSYMNFTKAWATRNINATFREYESIESGAGTTLRGLPSVAFYNQKEQLFGSSFYGTFESSFFAYQLETDDGTSTTNFDVNRFDIYPTISRPTTITPWLSVEPSLGYRSAFYSNGVDENGNETGESFSKEYYLAELLVTGPKLQKFFESESVTRPKLKHIITPEIKYSYVPDMGFDGEDRQKVKAIDGVDVAGSTGMNLIAYKIYNQLLAKEIAGDGQSSVISLLQFSVSQTFDLNEADRTDDPDTEKRPFSSVVFDLDTRLYPWLLFNYQTSFDIYEGVWDTSSLELGLRGGDFNLALDRTFTWGGPDGVDSAWDTFYVEYIGPGSFSADLAVIYDEVSSETTDSLLRLRYKKDCYAMALGAGQRKITVTDADGSSEVKDETRFTLTVTLKGLGDILGSEPPRIAAGKI